MSRTKPTLASTINAYAKLNAEIDELKEQQKALADRAYVSGLVQAGSEANARKVVAQLAKELEWEAERRASQAQMEMALDQGRVTLGIAVDPGFDQAVSEIRDGIRDGSLDMKIGDDPWMSETIGKTKAN